MSAFIVSRKTMARAVSGFVDGHVSAGGPLPERVRFGGEVFNTLTADLAMLGRALYRLNQWAVRDRYGTDDPVPDFAYTGRTSSPVRSLQTLCEESKALRCLVYQCSEGDAAKSPAYAELVEAANRLDGRIIRSLPQWNEAAWDA